MTDIKLIQSHKQHSWGLPVVANFVLGGAGTCFYLMNLIVAILTDGVAGIFKPIPHSSIVVLIVSLGFLSLTVEAAQPMRARYLFYQMRNSWISRETLAFILFVMALVLEKLYPHAALRVIAVVMALGLLISQGFIVYQSRAVTAWNVPIIPIIFVTSGFATGYGVAVLAGDVGSFALREASFRIGTLCIILNMMAWTIYLNWSSSKEFRSATKILRNTFCVLFIVGIGGIVPLSLTIFALAYGDVISVASLRIIELISGLALVVGGAGQKLGIIMAARYTREIVLRY